MILPLAVAIFLATNLKILIYLSVWVSVMPDLFKHMATSVWEHSQDLANMHVISLQ